jgi:hypothetical protein
MDLSLSPAKTNLLLEAGIEILHEESVEWLNDLDFWREENDFLFTLFIKSVRKEAISLKNDQLLKIERELIHLRRSGGELDELQRVVLEHEHFLKMLLENHVNAERNYRDAHIELAKRFSLFEKRFKSLKTNIFDFVKKLPD